MSKHLIAFLLSLLAWLIASNVKAQSTGATISTKKVDSLKAVKENPLSLSVDFSGTTDLEATESSESTRSTDLGLKANYQINKDNALSLSQAISYTNNGAYKVTAANTSIGAKFKTFKINEETSLTPSSKILLPTNEENREFDSFRGAAALALSLSYKTHLGAPVTFALSEEILKNVHEYESNAGNKANLSFRSRTAGALAFEFGQSVGLSLASTYDAGRTYQNALRTAFSVSQELSYKFTEKASTYISHSNGGDARGANGTDSQIKVADDRTSTISIGFRTIF